MREISVTSLVAGLVLIAIGTLLVIDRASGLHIGFGWLWPLLVGALGVVLFASGAARGRQCRDH